MSTDSRPAQRLMRTPCAPSRDALHAIMESTSAPRIVNLEMIGGSPILPPRAVTAQARPVNSRHRLAGRGVVSTLCNVHLPTKRRVTAAALPASPRGRNTTVPYAIAIFLSSSMLFLIEPIAGKRLLPLLGGSAAVWTACLVFFQCALLLGYLAAHWLVTRTRPRVQSAAYLVFLALSLVQLVLAVDPRPV